MCVRVSVSVRVCLENNWKLFMANDLWFVLLPHLPRFLRLSLRFRGCTSPDIFPPPSILFLQNANLNCVYDFLNHFRDFFLFYFSILFFYFSGFECVWVYCKSTPNAISSAAISARNWTERSKANRQAYVNVAAAASSGSVGAFSLFFQK